jgi:hypothetical protein
LRAERPILGGRRAAASAHQSARETHAPRHSVTQSAADNVSCCRARWSAAPRRHIP